MSPRPTTIATALRWPGIDPVDARVLLQHALGVTHAYLIAHSERVLTCDETACAEALFSRRLRGEPVAYLTGRREFYGRVFGVCPAVLIPRPETELLVELALARIEDRRGPRLLDLGTGSGCIALTLALERVDATIVAIDASSEALAVARRNGLALKAANVDFRLGRWFDAVPGERFDLIAANPPYIAADDPHLMSGDLRFEPRAALASGARGLDDLGRIIDGAGTHLVPGGWLLLEHGWNQADDVAAMLTGAGFEQIGLTRDLAGQPRVSSARARIA